MFKFEGFECSGLPTSDTRMGCLPHYDTYPAFLHPHTLNVTNRHYKGAECTHIHTHACAHIQFPRTS